MSNEAKDFISRTLEKDPIERPTIADMVNHSWIILGMASQLQPGTAHITATAGQQQ
jgi:serine/threonine protein kinase